MTKLYIVLYKILCEVDVISYKTDNCNRTNYLNIKEEKDGFCTIYICG